MHIATKRQDEIFLQENMEICQNEEILVLCEAREFENSGAYNRT